MAPQSYDLYYAISSLCSYMLRYSLAIRGPGKHGQEISIEERLVDIHYERNQLGEFYLLKVNSKGQVPAITSPGLKKPMADSLQITNYFATMFPNLKPAEREERIDEMLSKIHGLPYAVFSFDGHKAQSISKGTAQTMKDILKQDDISLAYRKTLEARIAPVANLDFDAVFSKEAAEQTQAGLADFFEYVDSQIESAEEWLFGLTHPSAADGHLVAFLARLEDVGRGSSFTGRIRGYAERAWSSPEWRSAMGTYTTTMASG